VVKKLNKMELTEIEMIAYIIAILTGFLASCVCVLLATEKND